MRTRFAVVAAVAMLSVVSACKRTKDNNLSDAIRIVPGLVEQARDVFMGALDIAKLDAKAHEAAVLSAKPKPATQEESGQKAQEKGKPILWKAPDSWLPKQEKIDANRLFKKAPHEDVKLHH